MNPSLNLSSLGNASLADQVAKRALESVPAYQAYCGVSKLPDRWQDLPCTDKKSYLSDYDYADLLSPDVENCFSVFSSSGSSGQPFYWPQLRSEESDGGERLRRFLEASFEIHERRTMAIIGLALGSWIGGDHFSWAMKNLSQRSPYPFSVFSPGNQHEEIIRMIHASKPFTDQILLLVCPSAIGHLKSRAEAMGMPLPLERMRFLVIGEAFPESMRFDLAQASGIPQGRIQMLSIFGSADTGVLGHESPASALIRGWCEADPELRDALGFGRVVPHLFHLVDETAFLENVAGELCITKWQGIPLIRYNLHDGVRLMSWKAILDIVKPILPKGADDVLATLPDVLAITGRSDACLILCGTNINEAMLDNVMQQRQFSDELTGAYRARTIFDAGRQRLELELEIREGLERSVAWVEELYFRLVKALGDVQPEFKGDWEQIYCFWDEDPQQRILSLKFKPWPGLSGEGIKHRGIQ
ncbi:hypothetical protein P3T73_10950 [Kiritimatiellota bacterium B12222]|nr:hypothetical protein P3T73_10950 [Kiritimatiellota bacterium B12222]